MDAYYRLAAINEALISIDEKTTFMGRVKRAAQTIGATYMGSNTPRQKLKKIKQFRRDRDASRYLRGKGDQFAADKSAVDKSLLPDQGKKDFATKPSTKQYGAMQIRMTGRTLSRQMEK